MLKLQKSAARRAVWAALLWIALGCCKGGADSAPPSLSGYRQIQLPGLMVDDSNLQISRSGLLYFTTRWGSSLWRVSPDSGLRKRISLSRIDRKPAWVDVVHDNDVWVALQLPNSSKHDTIARVVKNKVVEYELPATKGPRHISRLAFSPQDGSLWFNSSFPRLGRLNTKSGGIREYSTQANITAIAVDNEGQVWASLGWKDIAEYAANGKLLHMYGFWNEPTSPVINTIVIAGQQVWFAGINGLNLLVLGYVDAPKRKLVLCPQRILQSPRTGAYGISMTRYGSAVLIANQVGTIMMASGNCKTTIERNDNSAFVVSATFDQRSKVLWLLKKLASLEPVQI